MIESRRTESVWLRAQLSMDHGHLRLILRLRLPTRLLVYCKFCWPAVSIYIITSTNFGCTKTLNTITKQSSRNRRTVWKSEWEWALKSTICVSSKMLPQRIRRLRSSLPLIDRLTDWLIRPIHIAAVNSKSGKSSSTWNFTCGPPVQSPLVDRHHVLCGFARIMSTSVNDSSNVRFLCRFIPTVFDD